jgi:hypothetical protein
MWTRRLSCFTAIVAAVMLVAGNGAAAASHESSGVGSSGKGTTTTVHPALQQCTGPAHQCGKPICHTSNVTHCVPRPGPPGRLQCYTEKIKSCI